MDLFAGGLLISVVLIALWGLLGLWLTGWWLSGCLLCCRCLGMLLTVNSVVMYLFIFGLVVSVCGLGCSGFLL